VGAAISREEPSAGTGAGTGDSTDEERVVVAQGTFDVLHPGHLHYLRDAASMGDTLVVIVARSGNVTHKESPVVSGPQRREMVEGLDPVDEARLGHPEDIFVPIEEIRPDVIALGYDQHHDPAAIRRALAERGLVCEVRRASGFEPDAEDETGTGDGDGEGAGADDEPGAAAGGDWLLSTGRIIDRICRERC
jgi:FAD synthetase